MFFSEGLETKFNMSRHGSMTCEASKSTPIESYRLREMFLLVCVSHVVYTRHGHDLRKRPCKLSCLLFCLKLACRSAKAQALCLCQIYHLKMKKRMSRLGGPFGNNSNLSAGSELKVMLCLQDVPLRFC